jgi:hypothetical protein
MILQPSEKPSTVHLYETLRATRTMAPEPEGQHILGRHGKIQITPDNVLTSMVRRLEAATSRLEDIASSALPNSGDADASLNGASTEATPGVKAANTSDTTPKLVAESAPPAIEAFDELVNAELKNWLALSGELGSVIEGQSKAVEGAFAAQRQFLFVANKAKKPDDRTMMELLKDLQASMEKTDEFRQRNRDAALKDSLSMVADGVGSLGWVTIGQGGGMKPHEHINELVGGAQMYGNKVLKEYRDKYVLHSCHLNNTANSPDPTANRTSSGCRPTTSSSRPSPNTQRSTTRRVWPGTATASTRRKPQSPSPPPPSLAPQTSLLPQQEASQHRPARLHHQVLLPRRRKQRPPWTPCLAT